MNGVIETIAKLEAAGAALRLDGDEVRIRYREAQQREQLAHEIGFLRAHRDEVADLLRTRATVPVCRPAYACSHGISSKRPLPLKRAVWLQTRPCLLLQPWDS